MKQCKICKEFKAIEEFGSSGRFRKTTQDYAKDSQCRPCRRESSRKYKEKYYQKNREAAIQKTKQWREDNPERYKKQRKDHRLKNIDEIKAAKKAYYQSPQGRKQMAKDNKKYRARLDNTDKKRARWAVANALRRGKLTKPDVCAKCDKAVPLEAHHPDYSKQLDVVWLCKTCHEKTHHLNEGHES